MSGQLSAQAFTPVGMATISRFNGTRRQCRSGGQTGPLGQSSSNSTPFWFGLAAKGFKCVIFDAAQINPRPEVPCVQIINWSYQSSAAAFSNPPELLKELRRRFGHRPIGPEVPVPKKRGRMRAIRDQLLRATKAKADAIIWLAEKSGMGFFLGCDV